MKVFFVLFFSALVLYALSLPLHQYVALKRASTALAAGNLDGAMAFLEQARHEWPHFYPRRASAMCSEVTMARARHLVEGPKPDFTGAVGLARGLAAQCQATERDGEVARFVEHLAAQHLAQATVRCQQAVQLQDYDGALAAFQHLATISYPEWSLTQAHAEAAWCRLTYAKALTQHQSFEAALGQLSRVISLNNSSVRTAALQQVASTIDADVQVWLRLQNYPQVFEHLAKYQQDFEAYPETAGFLADLRSQVEYQVFGRFLSRLCRNPIPPQRAAIQLVRRGSDKRGQPTPLARPAGPFLVATAFADEASDGAIPTNLALQNSTPLPLEIRLRGPEQRDVPMDPQGTHALQLEAGKYAVVMYAPDNCHVKPSWGTWTIKKGLPLRVQFYQE